MGEQPTIPLTVPLHPRHGPTESDRRPPDPWPRTSSSVASSELEAVVVVERGDGGRSLTAEV